MTHRFAASLVLTLVLLPALAFAQPAEPERLRLQGSNRLGDRLVPSLVAHWLRDIGYSDLRHVRRSGRQLEIHASRDGERLVIDLRKDGTEAGLAAIIHGDADMALSTREPNAQEMDDAWQLGDLRSPTQEWVLGLDGLVVVVAPGNPVSAITLEQLRALAAGSLRDWRTLGGPAAPISLHTLGPASGNTELAETLLLEGRRIAARQVTHADYPSLMSAVAADPGAVALVGLRVPRTGVKALAVRGSAGDIPPEPAAVLTEDYPLQRRVYLHTGTMIPALARSFAEYVVSPAGQAVVEKSTFASVGLRRLQPEPRLAMPAEYLSLLGPAERLPATLRFSSGLDLFDSRSRQDINRLIAYLALPGNEHRRVVLMSFANPKAASPYQSLAQSQERVDYVASELLALGIKVVVVRGFGGQLPLVDARQPLADYRNNRVEVWLR